MKFDVSEIKEGYEVYFTIFIVNENRRILLVVLKYSIMTDSTEKSTY
jgi:hypothetical protein